MIVHWIGVDVGESMIAASLVDGEGRQLKAWSFQNRPAERKQWLAEVSSLANVVLVLESTESFSERLSMEARSFSVRPGGSLSITDLPNSPGI